MKLFEQLVSCGEKKAGSQAGALARQHIIECLQETFPDAKVTQETFPVSLATQSHAVVHHGAGSIPAHLFDNTGRQGSSTEGEIFVTGQWLSKRDRKRAKGKILVFEHSPWVHRLAQVYSAYDCGAAAVILVSSSHHFIRRGLGYPSIFGTCWIPAVGITRTEWLKLQSTAPTHLRIEYRAQFETVSGTNVIIDMENQSSTPGKIVLGAHYDSWYAGSQDNCIASQLLVDLLEELGRGTPLRHPLRGIFFDAEEMGILGSMHHTSQYLTMEEYRFYLNLEMPVPTPNGHVRGLLYSDHPVVKKSVSKLGAMAKGVLPLPLKWYYRFSPFFPSDIDGFYRNDIPCITTFCNNPHLHTPLDAADNVRMEEYPKVKHLLVEILRRIDKNMDIGLEGTKNQS